MIAEVIQSFLLGASLFFAVRQAREIRHLRSIVDGPVYKKISEVELQNRSHDLALVHHTNHLTQVWSVLNTSRPDLTERALKNITKSKQEDDE